MIALAGVLGAGVALVGAANPMVEKLRYVGPEIVLFVATVMVMVMGASPSREVRRSCGGISVLALGLAGFLGLQSPVPAGSVLPYLMEFAKPLIAGVGILLVLLLTGTVDREYEEQVERRGGFDAIRATRGEFHAFVLFSLTGLMLCATADDLIWLFLALELTSLPTYVMVAISSPRFRSQEAGVKYFFLGAFGAAMFLFGFALLYGATGTTQLWSVLGDPGIASVLSARVAETGSIGALATLGLVIAMVGVCFKIAAVPMHFYTPDVYQGAAATVAGYLAFVPKAAGFFALILLASTVGWSFTPGGGAGVAAEAGMGLPEPVRVALWVIAALTMTVGNVLALLQTSVKRILAYSSIAHSGYMLVGVIVGPGADAAGPGSVTSNGLAATLFYLLCYGFMNMGAFAVLACLERRSADGVYEEIDSIDDLRGLCKREPALGWSMVLCSLSLLGLPPLLGFFGKLLLFTSAIAAGEIVLVVVMGLNSAIAAFYYLRLAGAAFLDPEEDALTGDVSACPFNARGLAAVISAASVLALVPGSTWLMRASDRAATYARPTVERVDRSGPEQTEPAQPLSVVEPEAP